MLDPAGATTNRSKKVAQEYERGILNKDELQVKYGIGGNSRILQWCYERKARYKQDRKKCFGSLRLKGDALYL